MPDAVPWVPGGRPPERIDAGRLWLERTDGRHAPDLLAAINESLDHLGPWMPWAQAPATDASVASFLDDSARQWEEGSSFNYVLVAPEGVAGGCGLHARRGPGVVEIGYWVRTRAGGRGLVTAAAAALVATAFALPEVVRVEIRCDAANERSAAVAGRVGLRLEGRVPQSPAAPGETGEHLVFAIDAADYVHGSMRERR